MTLLQRELVPLADQGFAIPERNQHGVLTKTPVDVAQVRVEVDDGIIGGRGRGWWRGLLRLASSDN